MFDKGLELKKYIVIFFIMLVATSTYLYKYSLNINIQKFKVYTNLYFKHQEFSEFADSILSKNNIKEARINFEGVKVDYFEQGDKLTQVELDLIALKLKDYSFFFVKKTDGHIFIHLGSIPSDNKQVLVGLKYKSSDLTSDDCISNINALPEGTCNEVFDSDWKIHYFWHS